MSNTELTADEKGKASLTLGEVIVKTKDNFPDPRFRPNVHNETKQYHQYGINPAPYEIWATADGIGTKPELAERLSQLNRPTFKEGDAKYEYFDTLAYDVCAMIKGDVDRFGYFLLGITNVVDVNTATPRMISALAKGLTEACDEGGFPAMNGETAELGHRTSGYGPSRLNWNATGIYLINPDKFISGERLKQGQIIMGWREKSIRSNGLTRVRAILESCYLNRQGYPSKEVYFLEHLAEHLQEIGVASGLKSDILQSGDTISFFNNLMGHDFLEQMLVPWHELEPNVVEEVLRPSTLYGRVMYDALGGVDGEKVVDIIAAAHISGGGVPLKAERMLEAKKLGAHIEPVFEDPKAVTLLMEMVQRYLPEQQAQEIINERTACQQWNRGLGFLTVVEDQDNAERLRAIGEKYGIEIAQVGEILKNPQIEWRGHTWTY